MVASVTEISDVNEISDASVSVSAIEIEIETEIVMVCSFVVVAVFLPSFSVGNTNAFDSDVSISSQKFGLYFFP